MPHEGPAADQELTYQQNFANRKITLVILSTNNWSVIKENVAAIDAAIQAALPASFHFLDIGHARG